MGREITIEEIREKYMFDNRSDLVRAILLLILLILAMFQLSELLKPAIEKETPLNKWALEIGLRTLGLIGVSWIICNLIKKVQWTIKENKYLYLWEKLESLIAMTIAIWGYNLSIII